MPAEPGSEERPRSDRALRIASLVKQVPLAENLELEPDGTLRREGIALEMNPYCRRAVSKGVELASASGGECVAITIGPPSAADVLREAIAWGADRGVHLSDPEFAGSDTLATSRALAAAIEAEGPFDLVLVGRNTTDGDTGQVGPELAQLLHLPFAGGVRRFDLEGAVLRLGLEQDDGWEEVELELPAVLSVAERLIEPAKVGPEERATVDPGLVRTVSARELGAGPWGIAGSPTRVGQVRVMEHRRAGLVLDGSVEHQVAEAVRILSERGALEAAPHEPPRGAHAAPVDANGASSQSSGSDARTAEGAPVVAVLAEHGRPQAGAELVGAAAEIATQIGGRVVAIRNGAAERGGDLGAYGADAVVEFVPEVPDRGGGPLDAESLSAAIVLWSGEERPWAILAPSTDFGREVAARVAAALGAGLVGDAVAVDVVHGELVAAKPAFAGALVADITSTSSTRLVTVRPGVLPVPAAKPRTAPVARVAVPVARRLRVLSTRRDDDVEVLARAPVVIGVGTGVVPDEYPSLSALAALLGAELAATRKVTDKGWAPRARQVGITGRSISPRLYVAIGLSGKFNHMVGVRAAETVLAINADASAPVFSHADVGIVGDWHAVVPALEAALRRRRGAGTESTDGGEVPHIDRGAAAVPRVGD